MTSATITPAHGRTYRTKAEILRDWRDGKEFVIHLPTHETYASSRNSTHLKARGITHLEFRSGDRLLAYEPLK